jgi:hypothetical protein
MAWARGLHYGDSQRGLVLSLVTYAGWGIYGVAVAGAIVLTAKNAIFTPIYGAIILGRSWYAFLESYVSGLPFLLGLMALEYLLAIYIHPLSWIRLVAICLSASVAGATVLWFMLPKHDRRLMVNLVPDRFHRLARRFMPA